MVLKHKTVHWAPQKVQVNERDREWECREQDSVLILLVSALCPFTTHSVIIPT